MMNRSDEHTTSRLFALLAYAIRQCHRDATSDTLPRRAMLAQMRIEQARHEQCELCSMSHEASERSRELVRSVNEAVAIAFDHEFCERMGAAGMLPGPALHKCCGTACPGLPYPPSELAHPASCLGAAQLARLPEHAKTADALNKAGKRSRRRVAP